MSILSSKKQTVQYSHSGETVEDSPVSMRARRADKHILWIPGRSHKFPDLRNGSEPRVHG